MSAEQIVDAIIADLSGRSGLGDEWAGIDPDVRAEIRQHWIDIANTPLGHAVPGLHEAYKARNEAEGLRQIPTVEQVRSMEAERRYLNPEEYREAKETEVAEAEAEREQERWDASGMSPHDWGDR